MAKQTGLLVDTGIESINTEIENSDLPIAENTEIEVDTEIEIIKTRKDLIEGQVFIVSGNVATSLINKGLAKIK